MVGELFPRNEVVHYTGIAVLYGVAGAACLALLCIELFGGKPQPKWASDLNGTYVVLAPYLPCLVFLFLSAAVRKRLPTPRDGPDDGKLKRN